jgi:hypothetical protein
MLKELKSKHERFGGQTLEWLEDFLTDSEGVATGR